ncbi:KAP family P-loop NTPase fold protein [Lunatimonas salinarum]|uniref:KAP family P-loop NTPase fold protein n=1 Tax=Lunatimonas salinarum TaxID=1774590 RepID=UPI001AE0D875|nr:P-loop NTPase fold protein [Lunatimonas salinarum]
MNSLRSLKIKSPAGDPFLNCKLGRKKYAETLTQIINSYSDGFVLSINNKWGEGKTTFIEMWIKYLNLSQNGFKTIYFNAWEHDFGHDPMAAILSEIKTLNIDNGAKLNEIIQKAGKLSVHALPILLKALAEEYIDTETITKGVEEISKKSIEIFKTEVDEYSKKKQSLEEFKEALEEYVSCLSKPLIFFIDELDRCNPKYAVEVLEIVKHFFSVKGIVFVLSVDKEQLGNAIRGYYGSDNIDSDEYLRRFLDLEFTIPSPPIRDFLKLIFENSGVSTFIENPERLKQYYGRNEKDYFYNMANTLFSQSGSNLRTIEKIISHLAIVLKTFNVKDRAFPEILFLLLFLKFEKTNFYNSLKNKQLQYQDLLNGFHDSIDLKIKNNSNINFYSIEGLLIYLYHKSVTKNMSRKLIEINDDNKDLKFEPKFGTKEEIIKVIELFEEEGLDGISDLDDLLTKIEILDSLK